MAVYFYIHSNGHVAILITQKAKLDCCSHSLQHYWKFQFWRRLNRWSFFHWGRGGDLRLWLNGQERISPGVSVAGISLLFMTMLCLCSLHFLRLQAFLCGFHFYFINFLIFFLLSLETCIQFCLAHSNTMGEVLPYKRMMGRFLFIWLLALPISKELFR